MAVALLLLMHCLYGWYCVYRIVQKRKGSHITLYLGYCSITMLSTFFTLFRSENELMNLSFYAGCIVIELVGLFIVGYWAIDDMWKQYARILEINFVKIIVIGLVVGVKKSVYRTTFSGIEISYNDVWQYALSFLIIFVISEILLKYRLFGRIPSVFWKYFFIANYVIVAFNMLKIIFGGSDLYDKNVFVDAYIMAIVPVVTGSVYMIISMLRVLKNEISELEKYYDSQYRKYDNEAKQNEMIRELRHDLANHLQAISMMDEETKHKYLDELMEKYNVR